MGDTEARTPTTGSPHSGSPHVRIESPACPVSAQGRSPTRSPIGTPSPSPKGSPRIGFLRNLSYDSYRSRFTARTGRSLPSAFGTGSAGTLSGFVLAAIAANTMNGPGLLAIPSVCRHGGWLVSFVGLAAAALLTGDTAKMLSRAISISLHDRKRRQRRRLYSRITGGYKAAPDNFDDSLAPRQGTGDTLPDSVTGSAPGPDQAPPADYGTAKAQHAMQTPPGALETQPLRPAAGAAPAEDEEIEEEPEFGPLAREFLGAAGEAITNVLLIVSLVMLTCAQIVVTAQALDSMIVHMFGWTVGVEYFPEPQVRWSDDVSLQPFGTGRFAVSAGFLLDMVLCVTLGMFDLSANMLPQYLSSAATIFALSVFTWQLCFQPPLTQPVPPSMPVVGPKAPMIVGVAVFNFAYIIAVPSLQTEAKAQTDFRSAMWAAVLVMMTVYCYVGYIGGTQTAEGDLSANVLNIFTVPDAPSISKWAVYAYAMALALPIPVYVILLRRNLQQGNIIDSDAGAVAVSNLVPWLMAMLCYMQPWFGSIINWSSLLCLGFINYSVPLALCVSIRLKHRCINKKHDVSFGALLKDDREALRAAVYFVIVTFGAIPAAILLSLFG